MGSRRSKQDQDARTISTPAQGGPRSEEREKSPLPDSFPKQWPSFERFLGKLTNDEWAAHCYLAGYGQQFPQQGHPINCDPANSDGYSKIRYLTGKHKSFGREAFIRCLTDKERRLNFILRWDLANLFTECHEFAPRKIIILRRSRKRHESSKNRAVAKFVEEAMQKANYKRGARAEAIKKATERFGYAETRQVEKTLERDKQFMAAFQRVLRRK
jgi:hypothetical protein